MPPRSHQLPHCRRMAVDNAAVCNEGSFFLFRVASADRWRKAGCGEFASFFSRLVLICLFTPHPCPPHTQSLFRHFDFLPWAWRYVRDMLSLSRKLLGTNQFPRFHALTLITFCASALPSHGILLRCYHPPLFYLETPCGVTIFFFFKNQITSLAKTCSHPSGLH